MGTGAASRGCRGGNGRQGVQPMWTGAQTPCSQSHRPSCQDLLVSWDTCALLSRPLQPLKPHLAHLGRAVWCGSVQMTSAPGAGGMGPTREE